MKTKDMTRGPAVSLILGFAIPLLIGNLFQQVYSMVDTLIAGYRYGDTAIAAIGSTSSLSSLILSFASGLNSGYGILISRAFGAGRKRLVKRTIAGAVLLNVAISLLLTAGALAFLRPILGWLHTPSAIFDQAYRYIAVILAGLLVTNLYNMLAAILRALGDSRTPLLCLAAACLLNVGLDLWFLMGLDMGVAGAALATVISQGCSVLLCCLWIGRRGRELLPAWRDFRPEKQLLAEMLRTGSAMALMLSVFSIGSVILQSAINGLGQTVITAHTAARRIIEMLMQPLSTLATATATFVSQNWGAGQRERIRSALKKVLGLEVGWALLAWAAVGAVGEEAIRWLTGTGDGQVIRYGAMSLQYSFAFYPALGVLLCLRTAMQSMGLSAAPVLSSGIELSGKILGALWIIPRYGYRGASLVEPLTWLLCAAFLCAVFLNRQRALLAGQLCPAEGRCPTENG